MEVEENYGHVNYKICIPKFYSYKDLSHTFTDTFSLSVNKLRSLWRVTILPFVKENGEDERGDPINFDIGISLECQKCNVNRPNVEVYCSVQGRDQHEKLLPRRTEDQMVWRDILTSRLALKVFKLLEEDKLVVNLRFEFSGRDLTRAVDGVAEVSSDLGRLLESGAQSDVDLVTSDGVKLPAHSAILAVRSDLLQRAAKKGKITKVATPTTRSAMPVKQHEDTPINSTFGSMSSGYHSIASSPEYCASVSSSGRLSRASVTTPLKALAIHQPSPTSPSKVNRRPQTPKKVTFGQRPPTPRKTFISHHLTPARSPAKRPLVPTTASPSKRANSDHTPSSRHSVFTLKDDSKENDNLQIFHYRRKSPSSSNTVFSPESLDSPGRRREERTPLREVHGTPLDQRDAGCERLQVELSMSSSVATELLQWMYTGEADLGALSRPLLVAGLRHGMSGLARACEDHLAAALTPSSAPDVLYLAHKYGATGLQEEALHYAVQKAPEVTLQPSWASLGDRAPTLVMEFSRRLAQYTQVSVP